ncbi:DUF817 domain-containing protein [Brevibacterium luteolum]|uniref:DUF817 domain-containing protein n=1 Tax=Brevibacterium luteolum TaxID=199591 RepID=UPI00223B88E2|nr:DUF817 domain-containing protein [Brevibacterium luteolum]MCT1656932.1 DUF817 domain-containing protein [Brevibacterium luteolum]
MPSSRRPDFTRVEVAIDAWAHRRLATGKLGRGGRFGHIVTEFTVFVLKQAWACLFGAAMLAALVLTHFFYPAEAGLSRSDALVIIAIGIQVVMVLGRLETGRELWVIIIFHVVGTGMELFKTSVGSWSYGGDGLLFIGSVPLYTGFMYAAVGSYLVRVFKLFHLRFTNYPPIWLTALIAAAIYVNFFTHHYLPDIRWLLVAAVLVIWGRCVMHFRNHRDQPYRRMPVLISFIGVAFFIWIAENIGTYTGSWIYPHQSDSWELLEISKLVAWFLLMIISVVLVTLVYRPQPSTSNNGTRT